MTISIFSKKEKHKQELRDHRRLRNRYTEKPYHERNILFYWFAVILGWGSNLVSAITESAKVYAFLFGIIGQLVYGKEISLVCMVVGIVGIELSNRAFGRAYFKAYAIHGGHTKHQNRNLTGMVLCSLFSCFLSISGQFDALRIITNPPTKQDPVQLNVEDVVTAISPIVGNANQRATDYYEQRKWAGRISSKDAVKYKEYLDHAKSIEDSLVGAILSLPQRNIQAQQLSQQQYEGDLVAYETEIQQKGVGLLFVTIPALLFLYVSLWYEETYIKKKDDYLVDLYGAIATGTTSIPSTPQSIPTGWDISTLLQHNPALITQLLQQITGANRREAVPTQRGEEGTHPAEDASEVRASVTGETELASYTAPIGFHTQQEKEAHLLLQKMVYKAQQHPELYPYDKFTILHFSFKNGQPRRLTKDRIDWYVKDYGLRLQKLQKNPHATPKQLQNCEVKNAYWKLRQQELYGKQGVSL